MKRQQKPTAAQADLLRRINLDPNCATVTGTQANCFEMTYSDSGGPLHYWVVTERGKTRLCDEQPNFTVPRVASPGARSSDVLPEDLPAVEKWDRDQRAVSDPKDAEGQTRGEVDQCLQGVGLSKADRDLLLARAFDGRGTRQLATATGKSKSSVAAQLKRIKESLKGKKIPGVKGGPWPVAKAGQRPAPVAESVATPSLRTCNAMARYLAAEFGVYATWDEADYTKRGVPLAFQITQTIRSCPETLLRSETGPRCVSAIVDLLEAAKFGDSKRRVPGVVPNGSRKEVRACGRKALAMLTRPLSGNRFEVPAFRLWRGLRVYRARLAVLRNEWRKFHEPTDIRLEIMRALYADELQEYNKMELRGIFLGDPNNTLRAAARLAEKATRLSASIWLRGCKSFERSCPNLRKASPP